MLAKGTLDRGPTGVDATQMRLDPSPPHCDFSSDGVCGVADINLMFQVGDLQAGIATSDSTENFDLIDDDVIDWKDIDVLP